MLILKEATSSKHLNFTISFFVGSFLITLPFFSFYMQCISRNAISYLWYASLQAVAAAFLFCYVATDSPKSLIAKGNFK
jgi:hypothetical protein